MHFADLGSDASIRKALSQLEKQKFIRRLARVFMTILKSMIHWVLFLLI